MRGILLLALVSVGVLCGLAFVLFKHTEPPADSARPLVVYCAAALKPAMQATAAEYDRPVEFRFGNSEQILAQVSLTNEGDLFLPADDSYVRAAESKGLVAGSTPLARMQAVVLVQKSNPHGIAKFEDLLKKDLRFGQANPDAAAIGKVTREHLRASGKWDSLAANTMVQHTTVTDAANAVTLGSNDAAIVWDVVATNYPSLVVVKLPELDGAIGNVEIALLKSSPDAAAAKRFVDFVHAEDHGRKAFHAAGFTGLLP